MMSDAVDHAVRPGELSFYEWTQIAQIPEGPVRDGFRHRYSPYDRCGFPGRNSLETHSDLPAATGNPERIFNGTCSGRGRRSLIRFRSQVQSGILNGFKSSDCVARSCHQTGCFIVSRCCRRYTSAPSSRISFALASIHCPSVMTGGVDKAIYRIDQDLPHIIGVPVIARHNYLGLQSKPELTIALSLAGQFRIQRQVKLLLALGMFFTPQNEYSGVISPNTIFVRSTIA